MADLENSTELLKQALDELKTSSTLSSATLLKLGKAADALTKDVKDSEKAIEDEVDTRRTLAKTFKQFAAEIGSATQAVRENREDFRSLKPAVDAFGTAAKYASGKLGSAVESVGEAISGLSLFLGPKGKLAGMVLGGVTSIAGNIMAKYGEAAVEFAQAYGKFALDEVQRVSGAFKEMANVGGLAGTSIDGFAESARNLGLSMDQYAKLVGRNSEGLAAAGLTVSQGARALQRITTAGTEFEDKFLKLGFSLEQQTEFSARFLATQRNTTRINLQDTKALSEANRKYLEQIDELARLTGQSRDKVANELEAMSRELRFGATLAIAQEKGTREAIENTARLLEHHGSKEIAEGFKDIFGGATTERSQALMAATNNRAAGIAEALENGQITSAEAMRQFQAAVRETRLALGADEFERRVGKLGTVLDPMLVGMRRLDKAQDMSVESLTRAKKEQDKDATATGENVENLVSAQKALRDLAVQLDEIVMKQLFPIMAKNVRQFIEVLSAGAKKLAEMLGVDATVTGSDTTVPSTGDAAAARQKAEADAVAANERAKREGATREDRIKAQRAQREAEAARAREESARRKKSIEGGVTGDRGGGGQAAPAAPAPRGVPPGGGTSQAPASPGADEPSYSRGLGGGAGAVKLTRVTSKTGKGAQVNAQFAGAFQTLVDYLDQSGYVINSMGGFVDRDKRNQPGVPSIHKLGAAIDINPETNPLGPTLVTDMPAGISQVAASLGLGWGGNWSSPKDAMHFSAATSEGGRLIKAAQGGTYSGPKSGYPAILHGAEAVVPLPDGRTIPVTMTAMTDKLGQQMDLMGQQLGRFDQMIDLLQYSVDTQQRIYRATTG